VPAPKAFICALVPFATEDPFKNIFQVPGVECDISNFATTLFVSIAFGYVIVKSTPVLIALSQYL